MFRMSQRPRSHLFVSYSRSDRIAVDKLAADLRQRGYILWMDVDERGISPGEDWRNELVLQMAAAESVLACISPDFLDSPYCKAEIEQAQSENKPIYPVLIRRLDADHSLADFKLDHLQYSDLAADYAQGLRRLLVALPPPQAPLHRAMQIGRIAALIGVVAVLAFIGVLLATQQGIISLQPTITPLPPTPTVALANYDVGVLVSYFVVEPVGAIPQDEANSIIANFAKALDTQVAAELGSSGLSYQLDGPQGVPRIEGASAADREEAAKGLALQRGAKIVIYGVIRYDAAQQRTLIEPEFAIPANRFFKEADDITGGYAFGKDVPAYAAGRNVELEARVTALSYVMTGLFQYMTLHYDRALDAYQSALAVPNWVADDGKEIVYGLQGNAYMKLAEQAARQCDRASVLAHTDDAENVYKNSLHTAEQIDTNFEGRAYAGLANTYAVRALWLPEANDKCASRRINVGALQQASDYVDQYQKARTPLDLDAGVRRKLLLTEVQVSFLQWASIQDKAERNDPNNPIYQDFSAAVQEIIDGYSSKSDITWAFPVMEAHIFRGQAEYARGELDAALKDYQAALDIYNDPQNRDLLAPERAMTVYGLRGDAYLRMGDYASAAQAYGEALDRATTLQIATAVQSYGQRRQQANDLLHGTTTPAAVTSSATPEITAQATEMPAATPGS